MIFKVLSKMLFHRKGGKKIRQRNVENGSLIKEGLSAYLSI